MVNGPHTKASKSPPYQPAVYDRRNRLDVADFVFRAIEIVAVDHDKIGELAWLFSPNWSQAGQMVHILRASCRVIFSCG